MESNLFQLAAILFLSASLFHPHTSLAEDKYRLGLIAPLTGPLAQHGRGVLEGINLGLKAGDCSQNVELSVEDDSYDPKKSISAAQKLIAEKHVNLLLTVGSGPAHALAPITEQRKLPLFALAGDVSVSRGRSYVVRLRPPAAYEGAKIAELAKSEKIVSAVLVCTSNEFTLAVCDGVASELGDIVKLRQDLLPEESDFKTLISKIRQLKVSHIIPILNPGKLGLFAKQVRELKLATPFLGGCFFESTDDLEAAGEALHGSKYVMIDVSESFKKLFQTVPTLSVGSLAWSAIFYDAGRIICEASRKRDNPLSYIRTLRNYPGAVGEVTFVSEGGDNYLFFQFIRKQISKIGFVNSNEATLNSGE